MAVEVGVEAVVQMEDVVVKEAQAAREAMMEDGEGWAAVGGMTEVRPQPSGGPSSEMRRLST